MFEYRPWNIDDLAFLSNPASPVWLQAATLLRINAFGLLAVWVFESWNNALATTRAFKAEIRRSINEYCHIYTTLIANI